MANVLLRQAFLASLQFRKGTCKRRIGVGRRGEGEKKRVSVVCSIFVRQSGSRIHLFLKKGKENVEQKGGKLRKKRKKKKKPQPSIQPHFPNVQKPHNEGYSGRRRKKGGRKKKRSAGASGRPLTSLQLHLPVEGGRGRLWRGDKKGKEGGKKGGRAALPRITGSWCS